MADRILRKKDSIASLQNDNYSVPRVDLKILPKTFDAIHKGIQSGKILSAHDVSEGGIIGAIFEMCVGGGMGVVLDTSKVGFDSFEVDRPDFFLFNETAGCFIVELENKKVAEQLFKNMPFKILGKTKKGQKLEVKDLFKADMKDLKKAWQEPMKEVFA